MPKAFLSHSSSDKGFVSLIAQKLGNERIVYDDFTFEDGNTSIEEIFNGLNESDLFVFFISDTALNSKWVIDEVFQAKNLLDNGSIKKIYPIIIDKNITFNDVRIPLWLQEYNLRYVSKPTKVAQRILQKLKIVSWELFPINKEKEQLFIGRHDLKKHFHERLFNFELPSPIACIASGFEGIGRRKFFLNSLKDANNIKEYYKPLSIMLHGRSSIEDFILETFDLGFTDSINRDGLVDFLKIPLNEKIELAAILLKDVYDSKNKIFIIDNYSIVNPDGTVVEWFLLLIKRLRTFVTGTFLLVVSLSKVRFYNIRNNDFIYSLVVNELDRTERNNLFQALLDIDKLNLLFEDKQTISELFTGFPVQIKFAVDYIKNEGERKLLNNLNELVDYNSEIIAKSIQKYDSNENALVLLRLFSDYEYMSVNFIDKIYNGLPVIEKNLLQEFSNNLIIDYFGASGEYLRLNDGIRDYIRRSGIKLPDTIKNNIRKITEEGLKNYSLYEDDLSEFTNTIQEAFVYGLEIPESFLIPSHFLLAMRELYDNHKKYKEVIDLADRALSSYTHLDQKIKNEIQKWLCLALARKRESRLLNEIQKIQGPDHNFILAFYYRLNKNYEKALEKLLILRKDYPDFKNAKRELVQIYLNTDDFESAYELARENYNEDKNNPYYIQSYLNCILKRKDKVIDAYDLINKMLAQLKGSKHEKALEMYYSSKAQYEAFYLHERSIALQTINESIATFPTNIYPYLIKLEISRKFYDVFNLGVALNDIETKFKDHDLYNRLLYLSAKIIYLAINGKITFAEEFIRSKVAPFFPGKTTRKLEDEVRQISTGHILANKF
jgi:hypothetical protein